MEPVWIKVFAITIIECFAPPGKSVCQEQEPFVIEITDLTTCAEVLDDVLLIHNDSPNSIFMKEPKCEPKAVRVYPEQSKEDIEKGFDEHDYWTSVFWKGR